MSTLYQKPKLNTVAPLPPIQQMERGMVAALAKEAVRQNVRVLMKNGLKLNYSKEQPIQVDLQKAMEYEEQF